jgi:hypothetical protein
MGVVKRLALSWEDASFGFLALLAWLSASLLSYAHVSVNAVSMAGFEIAAATPSPGPIIDSIDDDDRESQKDNLERCELPGVWLVSPPSLTLSQITPPRGASHFVLTPAQRPLRC